MHGYEIGELLVCPPGEDGRTRIPLPRQSEMNIEIHVTILNVEKKIQVHILS